MHFPLLLLGITVVSGIIINDNGGGRSHGNGFSSSSSEEHGNRPRPHRPRPPRPNPPRGPRCPNDWITFNRPQGPWCVKVFSGIGTAFYAQEQCKTHGAVLTGVQDGNERSQIANAARIVNNANGGGSDVWIDGKRRAECPWKAACAPNDTFEWTDGHTTGTAGFWWPGIEPSGSWNDQWRFQSCLVIHVSAADGQMGNWGYPHGSMDDEHCQQTWRMYACGKRPS